MNLMTLFAFFAAQASTLSPALWGVAAVLMVALIVRRRRRRSHTARS